MIEKIMASKKCDEFVLWLNQLKEVGFSYEIVIENGAIQRVYVREDDDGNWGNILFGRVFGSAHLSFKQRVYQPRIVNDKLIIDYHE